jgi:penicillin-insensitive murein endopeptidase
MAETKSATTTLARFARSFAQIAIGTIILGLTAATIAGAGPASDDDDDDADERPAVTKPKASAKPQPKPDTAAKPAAMPADPKADAKASPTAPAETTTAALTPSASPATPAASETPPVAAAPALPELKPAKVLFGGTKSPAPLAARAIGSYAKGCLSGAKALPIDGPAWQHMRLSRNRNWGHPKLLQVVQRLARDGREKDGWPGLLVGDLSQPRGGPMLTGHASHQIGLDADVWLTPMPDRRLSPLERETMSATSMLADDPTMVSSDRWTEGHKNIIKRAASYSEVERVLVHPAIKQVLCHQAGNDRGWLAKVRPYWGHHYHFHIRIGCPPGSTSCQPQGLPPDGDGCGADLDDWLKRVANVQPSQPAALPIPQAPAAPKPDAKVAKAPPPMTLDKLPAECRVVLATGNPDVKADVAAAALAAAIASGKVKPPQPPVAIASTAVAAGDGKLPVPTGATSPPASPATAEAKPVEAQSAEGASKASTASDDDD